MKVTKMLDVLFANCDKIKVIEKKQKRICQLSENEKNGMLATGKKRISRNFHFHFFYKENCNLVSANEIQLCFKLERLLCKFCSET